MELTINTNFDLEISFFVQDRLDYLWHHSFKKINVTVTKITEKALQIRHNKTGETIFLPKKAINESEYNGKKYFELAQWFGKYMDANQKKFISHYFSDYSELN